MATKEDHHPNGILNSPLYEFSLKFASPPKSVRFADPIVDDVRERERTLECERVELFYSTLDIEQFRREYRAFRRLNRSKQYEPQDTPDRISSFSSSKGSDMHLISQFIHSAFTYATDQVITLQQTVTANFIEVLNTAAESEGNDFVMSSPDLFNVIDAY